MAKITLPLPRGWYSEEETLFDEGIEITHLQAYCPDDKSQSDKSLVDIYVGAMPEGSDAENEALNSYADIVGLDEDEEDPLTIWPFQGKQAFGFEAICDGDSPMRVMNIEILPGVLCIIMIADKSEKGMVDTALHLAKHLKVVE